MQKLLTIFLFFVATKSFAQIPEDAVRYSWFPQNGTARSLAIGGTMGSLGGDLSATFVNPAGIGFFKTSEVAISPSFVLNNVKTNYRGTQLTEKKNSFSFGTSGFVYAMPKLNHNNSKWTNAFSVAFTQNANFNNIIHYKGLNNLSSNSEQLVEEY